MIKGTSNVTSIDAVRQYYADFQHQMAGLPSDIGSTSPTLPRATAHQPQLTNRPS